MALKHDPTKGMRMPPADPNDAARRGEYAGVDMGNNPAAFIAEQQVCSVNEWTFFFPLGGLWYGVVLCSVPFCP